MTDSDKIPLEKDFNSDRMQNYRSLHDHGEGYGYDGNDQQKDNTKISLNLKQSNGVDTNSLATPDPPSSHCHLSRPQSPIADEMRNTNQRKLLIASVLCLVFMIAEAAGGLIANSLAVLTDSAHLLADFAAFMISLFAIHVATRQPTKKYSFGWHRAEIMGALMSMVLLWLVTGILVFCAIQRLANQEFELKPKIMLITSGLGLLINLVMALILFLYKPGGLPGHSHGISSSNEIAENMKNSVNIKAAIIHVLGDMVQSTGVMIAAIIIYIEPKAKIADPLCTLLFSVIVMFSTYIVIKDIFSVLMEGVPKSLQNNNVENSLLAIPGVKRIHNLRLWSLSLDKQAIAVHIVSENTRPPQDLLEESHHILRDGYGLTEATIQIEMFTKEMAHCLSCNEMSE